MTRGSYFSIQIYVLISSPGGLSVGALADEALTLSLQLIIHSLAHFDNIVVAGSAITIPRIPNSDPQTDSERKITAGFNPIAFPIILGVNTMSENASTNA